MTTIYFSGSISGGREDVETYRQFVAALERAGHRVLAGMVTATHVSAEGEALPACDIFDRDVAWIEEAARKGGALVAEVSRPSTGVGYEIAMARYHFGMPVICLYRPAFTRRCSGMIAGDRAIRLIEYTDETIDDATKKLLELLANNQHAPAVKRACLP
ncbi:MAG TPA: nucleoside 2-deoxyribosyltransferase [Thermoanaerobaculia bacterium]